MGKRGPAKTPTSLQVLRGNPGKRAVNRNEPKPSTARIAIPKYLNADAKSAWKKIAPELKKLGLLTVVDVPLLSMLCTELARYWMAEAKLQELGAVEPAARGGWKPSPYLGILNRASQRITTIAGQFGMSPSARTSLNVEGPQTMSSKLFDLMALGKHGKPPTHTEEEGGDFPA